MQSAPLPPQLALSHDPKVQESEQQSLSDPQESPSDAQELETQKPSGQSRAPQQSVSYVQLSPDEPHEEDEAHDPLWQLRLEQQSESEEQLPPEALQLEHENPLHERPEQHWPSAMQNVPAPPHIAVPPQKPPVQDRPGQQGVVKQLCVALAQEAEAQIPFAHWRPEQHGAFVEQPAPEPPQFEVEVTQDPPLQVSPAQQCSLLEQTSPCP